MDPLEIYNQPLDDGEHSEVIALATHIATDGRKGEKPKWYDELTLCRLACLDIHQMFGWSVEWAIRRARIAYEAELKATDALTHLAAKRIRERRVTE
jgi:hypothetical protein